MLNVSSWTSDKCKTRYCDYMKRKAKHKDMFPLLQIDGSCYLHRLIREGEFEDGKLDQDAFEDKSLSVFIEGDDFPKFNIQEIVANGNHIGAYRVSAALFFEGNYALVHDPFPDSKERSQHANHGQVFCSKAPDFRRKLISHGDWSVKPEELCVSEISPKDIAPEQTVNETPAAQKSNLSLFSRLINWIKELSF